MANVVDWSGKYTDKMKELYRPTRIGETIQTVAGQIPITEWIQNEADRINRNPLRYATIVVKGDSINLLVNAWEFDKFVTGVYKQK